MELKTLSNITEADCPLIESPFFAKAKIRDLYLTSFPIRIKGLDKRVRHYIELKFSSRDQQSVYWKYFKSGGREDTWEYQFNQHDCIKDAILKELIRVDYLLVCDPDTNGYGGRSVAFQPLLIVNTAPDINTQDRWRIPNPTVVAGYQKIDNLVLKRLFPNRKTPDYSRFFGSASGETENTSRFDNMPPEPWPEQRTLQQTSIVAAAAQPALQPTPNPKPTPTLPRGPAVNDPVFNVKKGIRLARVLGGIPGVILGALIPDNASLEEEWEVDGVNYKYNTDDFSLEITHPDGTEEQVKMYPDGTVTDQQGAIMGSVDKDGHFEPATEQEDVEYRVWKANGGDGSFAVWKNSGKPSDVSDAGVKNTKTRLPRKDGKWDGKPGEGNWHSDLDEVNKVTGGKPIPFKKGRPDFSEWSKGEVTFKKGELNGTDEDFSKVYEKIAKEKGLKNKTAAKKLLKEKGLTPHHLDDKTIQLIPSKLHGKIPHIGSASDMKNI